MPPVPAELHRFIEPVLTSVRDRGEPGAHAGVELLRAALFYLQRQTHHWGHVPPADEREMRILLAAIRQACSVIVDGGGQHESQLEGPSGDSAEGEPGPAVTVSYNPHQQPSLTQAGPATADVYVALRPSGWESADTQFGEVQAIVSRNRYGPCGAATLILRRDHMRFANAASRVVGLKSG